MVSLLTYGKMGSGSYHQNYLVYLPLIFSVSDFWCHSLSFAAVFLYVLDVDVCAEDSVLAWCSQTSKSCPPSLDMQGRCKHHRGCSCRHPLARGSIHISWPIASLLLMGCPPVRFPPIHASDQSWLVCPKRKYIFKLRKSLAIQFCMITYVRGKRRIHLFLFQEIPLDGLEPRMRFKRLETFFAHAKSFWYVSCQQPFDYLDGFRRDLRFVRELYRFT